jgi:hypothetical protein
MYTMKKSFWILFCFLVLVAPTFYPVRADSGGVIIPPGFRKIDSAIGIDLYKKDYPGGSPDYVQIIDLSQGARLKPMIRSISDPGVGQGVYGGNDAHFRSQSLSAYWQELSSKESSAYCVVNGQFFYMLEYPTRLPFPLKIDGKILTDGYGIKDFPDQKLMLELWHGRADIVALSKQALYSSTAPDIIAGLTEEAPKAKKRSTGRTFIGLTDPNGSGQFSTLMIFNTKTARQVDAAKVLKSFGAQKVMMLDGGGSTQLLCRGKAYVYSERLIPQAIGIIAGVPGEVIASPEDTPVPDKQGAQEAIPTATEKVQPDQQERIKSTPEAQAFVNNQSQSQQKEPLLAMGSRRAALPIILNNSPYAVEATIESGTVTTSPNLTAGDQAQNSPSNPTPARSQPSAQALSPSSIQGQAPNQASSSTLSAGITPVRLDDVLWVPVSMAPVLMILLFGIFRIRSREV